MQRSLLLLEKQITAHWHRLLIRNTAYQQDAALWDVHTGQIPHGLGDDSLLLEYFTLDGEGQLALFLVFPGENRPVQAISLPVTATQVERLLQSLRLNLSAVPTSSPQARPALEANARRLLNRLYDGLLAPAASVIAGYERLVIVPHGGLHYLPFHALHDGQRYLIETHAVRYLPAASLLPAAAIEAPAIEAAALMAGAIAPQPSVGQRPAMLAMGHSFQGRLPETLNEAAQVAGRWGGQPLLEREATVARLRNECSQYRLIHLACHGEFRADNPLFSGLALEDGWLTTLDIFNLRLNASLVTLSACQTGLGVLGGGDELSGLMRAFLSSGAESLVLSQWAVADRAAACLMGAFYAALASGEVKSEALRQAQLDLLSMDSRGGPSYHHPYFWAPFSLIGADGRV